MYISKLKIKNFKCFDDVEINFDPNFNLIIGANNSGKSTVFDALRLWQLAFKNFLKKDSKDSKGSSFYATQFFSFTLEDISFLRILDFKNLFRDKSSKDFTISLTVSLSDHTKSVNIPIIFSKTTEGQVLKFQLCTQTAERKIVSKEISGVFNIAKGSNFKKVFLFTYINPIFLLPNKEPQYSKGYILNKLHQAKANEIIRNLLFNLFIIPSEKKKIKTEEEKSKIIDIENSIKNILKIDIQFSKEIEDTDSFIKIFASASNSKLPKDNKSLKTQVEINQLGSGTINVLNILAVLGYGDYEAFKLNALLLDEPDSHLHFNHQSRLYQHLKTVSLEENKQIFIITHNSSLISQFENILYINNEQKIIKPISLGEYLEKHLKQIDENYYKVMKQLSDAKKENDRLENELSEYSKPIIYCEGTSDQAIFKKAFHKLYEVDFFDNKIKLIPCNGVGGVANTLKNNKTDKLLIGVLDNDKSGQNQFNKMIKDHNFKKQDDIHYANSNNHLLILPIPEFRLDSADFFTKNMYIEYCFTDETLEKKLKIELKKYKGENFKRFDEDKLEEIKRNIITKIDVLDKEDFEYFIPLFEKIATIISFILPEIDFKTNKINTR